VDDETIEIEILDTAGSEEFRKANDNMLKERDGYIIVFDLSDP
jgi:GTPase SAR1 family protein